MIPIINRFVFRTADSMYPTGVQINQCQIFRIIAGSIAGKGFVVHRYPVPFEIIIMLHFLHNRGIFFFVSIVGTDHLKWVIVRETDAFLIQSEVFVL